MLPKPLGMLSSIHPKKSCWVSSISYMYFVSIRRSSILSEKGEAFDIHKRRTGARRDAAVESGFVRELIMSSINKNYVDMDEYPLTTELQLTKLSAKCGRRFLVTLYLMSLVGKLFHFMVTVENSNGFFLEHMGMAHRGFSLGLRESKA
ncbi:hypothetical protein L6164_024141 [Bauhinia variegata]|uniref:Uncharacterized protein n=1 Tax=Bauhinia variegata TaxID=167791 RepID=A0ACB9LWL3_BAUVA|nr:hypothetical protein L6164_024141 [Bauhinia variegata]